MDYLHMYTEQNKECREVDRGLSDIACWSSHGDIIDNTDDNNIDGNELFFNTVKQSVVHLISSRGYCQYNTNTNLTWLLQISCFRRTNPKSLV